MENTIEIQLTMGKKAIIDASDYALVSGRHYLGLYDTAENARDARNLFLNSGSATGAKGRKKSPNKYRRGMAS